MINKYFCILLWATLILNCSSTEIESSEIKNGQCGGTIELDSGTLIYPGEGLISPGELCIWTIHLRTMDGFRMNFTNLDLPGQDIQCSNAAVGIYSLTNLIPNDNLEKYRFCNENNNDAYHFLTGNVATVVFYTSSSFEANSSATGFSLHWEGSRFQPVPVMHSSTYTSSPSGVVWYPVEGEYAPNAALTWLVNGAGPENASSLIIDILSVDFESCNLVDRCLCDALIIYDISSIGDLHEVDRFCGEREGGIVLPDVSTDFIVAFYSDNNDIPDVGQGFRIDWRQERPRPSTTTENPEEPTTTPGPEGPIITRCGGIIEENEGTISYMSGESYAPFERCVWTIRPSLATQKIEFHKLPSNFSSGDYISAFGFVPTTGLRETIQLGKDTNDEVWADLDGLVAVVVFTSDGALEGTGFNLRFRAVEGSVYSNYNFDLNTAVTSGSLRHPASGSVYQNSEMSTFVMSKGYHYNSTEHTRLTINSLAIEDSTGCQYDGLIIYTMSREALHQIASYCGSITNPINLIADDVVVMIFFSDQELTYAGFDFSWN